MVKITKWTGIESVSCIHIKPQITTLNEHDELHIEVENPYSEKNLFIRKHEKIACLSILSAPIPSGLYSRVSYSPDRFNTDSKRWFKVTNVVLHKKGEISFRV